MKKLSVFILIVIIALSCNKEDDNDNDSVEYYFTETQCSNPFELNENATITHQNVKKFLLDSGILVYNSKLIYYEAEAVCMSCSCPRLKGHHHVVGIKSDQIQKIEKLGFKRLE